MSETVVHSLSVGTTFPLCVTVDTWNSTNTTFLDVVKRLHPDRRHRLFFVVDEQVARAQPALLADARAYCDAFPAHLDLVADPVLVPGGEVVKNDLTQVTRLLQRAHEANLDGQSLVVVIGGGAVLDMVSFAAAITRGGLRVVRLPASVVAQAVSGVCVHAGVHLFDSRDFLTTLAPPCAVILDSALLTSLDPRDRIAGMVEVIRVAVLHDSVFFRYLEGHVDGIVAGDPAVYQRLTRRSAALHLQHVCGKAAGMDSSKDKPLEFGYWALDALQSMTGEALRQGEVVAIATVLDAMYAVEAGFLPLRAGERIVALCRALGLPVWHPTLQHRGRDGGWTLLHGLRAASPERNTTRRVVVRAIGAFVDVPHVNGPAMRNAVERLALPQMSAE